jgi:hypothetical protein
VIASSVPLLLLLVLAWIARPSRRASYGASLPRTSRDIYVGDDSDVAVRADLRIRYIGGSGAATDRNVSVDIYNPDRGWIVGHCHLKNGRRTFYLNRVEDVTDLATGDVVTGISSFLRRHQRQ